ncbi:MAG: dehypoxanthine futalosine cyclase [Rikenellaceae bacterium]|nr:dehypoxanthine futalosine cyclase [Rikenellaceae bacterium]MCL2693005.1 dehypoxanthine futalosine cyclase [Rikenellaceae bacterium]
MKVDEALDIYLNAPLGELAAAADERRRAAVPDPQVVTWQIDRNVNITNVCISGCRFCNFHRPPHSREAFITSLDEYRVKIAETLELGGDQLLLQGGLHPQLGIKYYEELFRTLKTEFPSLKLHALGPPEIAHIARVSRITTEETLRRLVDAGLDSLPGAGAEILDDGVRRRISPRKPSAAAWLDVMRIAHRLGIPTSATMMYGHVETPRQRIEHLIKLRDLQEQTGGFSAFIPWIFRGEGTPLAREEGIVSHFSPTEYLRTVAISRIVLRNIRNIQASWLTVGTAAAQMALHCGANDMGSIMIEENVVASAGAHNRLDASEMQAVIRAAGFTPRLRDQAYDYRTRV